MLTADVRNIYNTKEKRTGKGYFKITVIASAQLELAEPTCGIAIRHRCNVGIVCHGEEATEPAREESEQIDPEHNGSYVPSQCLFQTVQTMNLNQWKQKRQGPLVPLEIGLQAEAQLRSRGV